MRRFSVQLIGTFLIVAVCIGMLGLWGSVFAQSQGTSGAGKAPFASSIDQREEMVRELREIRAIMKEQTILLQKLVDQGDAKAKSKK